MLADEHHEHRGGLRVGREKSRGRLEDLIGPPQLGHLLLERLDLRFLLARESRPLPGIDLARRSHLRTVSGDPIPSRAATALIAVYSLP